MLDRAFIDEPLPDAAANLPPVDAMVTNFHVPRSTLMMLVSAFSTREQIMGVACAETMRERYRMLSFGDAMLIL